jgi:hypothetical protein
MYKFGKLIKLDELIHLQIEKKELERLLEEVKYKERIILKKKGKQTWIDYVWELLGY